MTSPPAPKNIFQLTSEIQLIEKNRKGPKKKPKFNPKPIFDPYNKAKI